MAMTINTNIVSLNAQRNLGLSGNSLSSSMQRLSSGLRVNSAKDDAAGLAIAERMNAQAKGLAVAARNANDGISLAQTAEGALGKMGDMLQRMRELAVQSSNATNSYNDRKALQAEVSQLRSEIDRVAKTTTFNGTKILDGSFAGGVFQVGAGAGDNITVGGITNAKASALSNVTYGSNVTATVKASSITNLDAIATNTLSIRVGSDAAINLGPIAEASSGQERLGQVVSAINAKTADTGVTAFLVAGDVEGDYTVELRSESGKGVSLNGFTEATTGVGRNTSVGLSSAMDTAYKNVVASIDALLAKTGLASDNAAATATTITVAEVKAIVTAADAGALAFTGLADGTRDAAVSALQAVVTNNGRTTANADAATYADATEWADGTESPALPAAAVAAIHAGLTAMKDALANAMPQQQTINLATVQTNFTAVQNAAGGTAFDTALGDLNTSLSAAGMTAIAAPTLGATATAEQLKAAKDLAVADANYQLESGFGIKTSQVTAHKGMDALDIGTQAGAWEALKSIDSAIDQVNSARADLGALQTRFEKSIENIDIMNENISAARGRIVDADFASETANLSRAQILQQAGTAMVAQANQLPQQVLSLLQ
ncbi:MULTISPECIES: flagellin [Comamonas]|uniref:flagellin N-terminal helical domain-containing protein n=1 Tax=Comamonas TaxID=283 RepID=UPI00257FD178|nr:MULTISPECIES: flagellin [Comamonas]